MSSTLSAERYAPIPGLLALHIRRGDFEQHCKNLADWQAGYVGFNSFPELPDKFSLPPDIPSERRRNLYRPRCYPNIWEIVNRASYMRQTEAGQGLQNVYIMTNAPIPWVDKLKAALLRTNYWDYVASSRDLLVNLEQKYVKQAVDMLIGQRAQVFVGNGVRAFDTSQALRDLTCPQSSSQVYQDSLQCCAWPMVLILTLIDFYRESDTSIELTAVAVVYRAHDD